MARWSRSDRDHDQHRPAAWERPITLRLAEEADAAGLELLAQLDSCPLPPGPYLVAERGHRMEAAISLATGDLLADPFQRTAELCELLRCHAGGVRVTTERSRRAPLEPRPRLATA